MDKKLIFLIGMAVAVSGCTSLIQTEDAPEGIEPDPGKGLQITNVSVEDDRLRVGEGDSQGQRTELHMTLSNHHRIDINPEIRLANTGYLEVEDGSADENCNKDKLDAVKAETVDQMSCSWGIYAPNQEKLGAFNQKQVFVTVIVEYDSQVVNRQPLVFSFKDRNDIEESTTVTRKFSNSEVTMTIKADNPAALQSNYNQFEISMRNSGSGSVESEGYDFSYTPRSIFEKNGNLLCPDSGRKRNTQYDEFSETCSFSVDSEAQRNVFVSADYKYKKQQTLPITIFR